MARKESSYFRPCHRDEYFFIFLQLQSEGHKRTGGFDQNKSQSDCFFCLAHAIGDLASGPIW